jgi:MFS transporter, ACS family, hexuronate transporter
LGTVLWIPPLGWEVGYFFWGWVSDRFQSVASQQRGWVFGALGLLSLALAGAPYLSSVPLVMAAMFFAMFLASGFVILSIAYATGVFGTGSSGLIAGTGAGSWSAGIALIMPLIGRMFDAKQYNEAFLAAAVVPMAGAAGFLLFDYAVRRREMERA